MTATELVELIGVDGASAGGLIAEVRLGASGCGGNIAVETRRLIIQDGARITLNTHGEGLGDNLVVNASKIDASNQIAQGCAAGAESVARNEFIITGRGGLPPSPNEPLNGETVLTEWATLKSDVENRSDAVPYPNFIRETAPTQIGEALLMGDRFQRQGEDHSFCTHSYTE